MEENVYEFQQVDEHNPSVFSFYSKGIRLLKKIVSFEKELDYAGFIVVNLVLSDENEDGTLDAEVDSDNGDILKVLNTVAAIIEYYSAILPNRAIYIKGADERRVNVYKWRIIRALNKSTAYRIFGQKTKNGSFENFDKKENYVGFLLIPQIDLLLKYEIR